MYPGLICSLPEPELSEFMICKLSLPMPFLCLKSPTEDLFPVLISERDGVIERPDLRLAMTCLWTNRPYVWCLPLVGGFYSSSEPPMLSSWSPSLNGHLLVLSLNWCFFLFLKNLSRSCFPISVLGGSFLERLHCKFCSAQDNL